MSLGSLSSGADLAKASMMKDGTFLRSSSIFCWHACSCRFAKTVSMDGYIKRIFESLDRQFMYSNFASLTPKRRQHTRSLHKASNVQPRSSSDCLYPVASPSSTRVSRSTLRQSCDGPLSAQPLSVPFGISTRGPHVTAFFHNMSFSPLPCVKTSTDASWATHPQPLPHARVMR